MTRCAVRRRRRRTSAIAPRASAITATPRPARATIPVVVVRSSTAGGDRPAGSTREQRRVLLPVVVGGLLAVHRRDGDGDRQRGAYRRSAGHSQLDGG